MASQDQDKASANLLRQSLRDSGEACPEPEILAAYFERSLDAAETARYELHFSQCARCREQLAAMNRAGEPAPAGRTETQQAARWAWLWDWRWLAPVAAVLVVAAVWLARRPVPNKLAEQSSQPPLVAMSQPSEPPAAPVPAPTPEQYAVPSAKPPSKALVAPAAGVAGAIKQSPALTESRPLGKKEEVVSNLPLSGRKVAPSDELTKDSKAPKRDSAGAASGAAVGGVASSIGTSATIPPAAPSSPPPASGAASVPAGNAEQVTVTSMADTLAPTSAAAKAKPTAVASNTRTLTQQAQTQTVLQSQALAIEAVDRRLTANIIATPDPKVLWRIAEGGFVERTMDGGASWQGQLPDEKAQLTAGSAPSAKVCWLVGRAGVILLTKDAKHWKAIPPSITADFIGVTAQDASSATVTTADGRKFTTSDGGKRWNPAP